MLYIKNVSAKLIHIGSVMLKPDEKVADKVSDKIHEQEHVTAENYSDIPSVKAMIRMGLLEIVDVIYEQKDGKPKDKKEIKKEVIAVDEIPEEKLGEVVASEEENIVDTPTAPTTVYEEAAEEEPKEEKKPKSTGKGRSKSTKAKAE